jgi:hypothetical protein
MVPMALAWRRSEASASWRSEAPMSWRRNEALACVEAHVEDAEEERAPASVEK